MYRKKTLKPSYGRKTNISIDGPVREDDWWWQVGERAAGKQGTDTLPEGDTQGARKTAFGEKRAGRCIEGGGKKQQ